MKTHKVLDLHYLESEDQSCFTGTEQECNDYVSTQSTVFMYQILPMTKYEIENYPDNQSEIEQPLTDLEKQIAIAIWLGWMNDKEKSIMYENKSSFTDGSTTYKDLMFDIDSNWQFACIEKIGLELENETHTGYSIHFTYIRLATYSESKRLKTRRDIFNAIYNYITQNKNE